MKYGQLQRFSTSLNKYKPSTYQTSTVCGPFAARRHSRVKYEHNKEYSFSPRINKSANNKELDYVQKRHLSMMEEGYFEDIDEYLIQQLDDMKEFALEEEYIQSPNVAAKQTKNL